MVNTRQKGMALSNYVADQIVSKGLDPKARADGGSGAGTREKADISTSLLILGNQIGIECKNHAKLHLSEWWTQTKKLETLGQEPVLVYKEFGEPMEGAKAVIYLDTLLELLKAVQGTKRSFGSEIARDRAIEQVIQAAEVLKK